ncbi:MAG TPA: alpha/beta hydrolase [Candidatus Hydrogenedentes bacterium]|nr:alpha/beta hydrolase [Candidatus Hydrogenedentota bacterium]
MEINTAILTMAGVCVFVVLGAAAGEAPVLSLATDGSAAPDKAPRLHLFPLPEADAPSPAVVVCPGGGYAGLAMDYEGVEVAQWLNRHGLSAFVLEYRVAPHRHPAPLDDAQRAMRLIRERAVEWGVDPARLGILGFSAGGHLASTVSTHYHDPETRPDFTILIYPVISFLPPFGHAGCGDNLLGKNADTELVRSFSNHERVTTDTPPAFLVASTGDTVVPAGNSIAYYQALVKAGVPAELHVYEQGEHGYGMGKGDPALSTWTDLCVKWLQKRGVLNSQH